MDKIRWGILGCAGIARKAMIPGIRASRLGEIAAIASRDGARAAEWAAEFGIPRAHGSYDALLADPEVDAIYNPLPNHLHVPITIRALEAGKPVLCEKPVALNAAEARELAAAQTRTGRAVAEAFMIRHHPQWRAARDILRSGRIGEARAIQTAFTYYLDDPANVRNQAAIGGGGLYDVGCYAVNTARYLFEAEPIRAIGLFDTDPAFGTDRLASGLLEFPGGRQLAFTCATQLALTQRVTVLGSRGRIELPVPFNPPAGKATALIVDDGRDLTGGGREEIAIPPADQYALQADAFAAAILARCAPEPGLDDAIANMRAIDALFRSAESGRWEQP